MIQQIHDYKNTVCTLAEKLQTMSKVGKLASVKETILLHYSQLGIDKQSKECQNQASFNL